MHHMHERKVIQSRAEEGLCYPPAVRVVRTASTAPGVEPRLFKGCLVSPEDSTDMNTWSVLGDLIETP